MAIYLLIWFTHRVLGIEENFRIQSVALILEIQENNNDYLNNRVIIDLWIIKDKKVLAS